MRIARWLIHHRVLVLGLLLPLTVAAAWLGLHTRFDFTPQAIFAGDGDLLEHSEAFKDVFGHDDGVLLVALESTSGDAVLTAPGLAWAADFATVAAAVPRVAKVKSLATVSVPDTSGGARRGPESLRLVPLLASHPPDAVDLERVETVLAARPLLAETFVSADHRVLVTLVEFAKDARGVDAMRTILDDLRERAAALPRPPDTRMRWTGLPVMRTEVVKDLEREQVERIPLTAVIFLLVLLVAFRRPVAAIVTPTAVFVGLIWAAGVFVLAGFTLNIISNILPVFLFTVGTANCVHLINRYAEEYHRKAGDREAAAARTVAHMSLACLLTYLTTAIGFLSLLAARSGVLKEVGWETAIGLALLYGATILVLGTSLPFFRPPRHPEGDAAAGQALARTVAAAGYAVARHPWPIVLGSLLLIGVSLFLARSIPVNSHLLETYEEDHPVTSAVRLVDAEFGGVLAIDVDLQAERDDAFLDPDTVERLQAITTFAADQPDVLRVRSFLDLHAAVVGEKAPLTPPRLRFAHLVCTQLADLVEYRRVLSPDGRRARIRIGLADIGSRRVLALADALQAELATAFPPGSGVRTRLTGEGYVAAAAMDHFIRDMLRSLVGAAVIIFAVIALLFRSPRIGLISMLPNLTPLVLTLGYMRLRGYELNASSVLVFAISLGVAVDNTIHFLARFREEIAENGDLPRAIQKALYGAGRAMVLTSVLLVLGLLVLHLSDFVPTRRLAELTSITMAAALLGDLLLLPACLRLFGAPRARTGT